MAVVIDAEMAWKDLGKLEADLDVNQECEACSQAEQASLIGSADAARLLDGQLKHATMSCPL